MSRSAFILAKDVALERLDPGITRQMLGYGDEIMTCRVWFEAGAIGAVHPHPHSQTSYCESGRFLYQVDDEKIEIGPGDCVYVAPHRQHGALCLETGVLIDNFSPMRSDFLRNQS